MSAPYICQGQANAQRSRNDGNIDLIFCARTLGEIYHLKSSAQRRFGCSTPRAATPTFLDIIIKFHLDIEHVAVFQGMSACIGVTTCKATTNNEEETSKNL